MSVIQDIRDTFSRRDNALNQLIVLNVLVFGVVVQVGVVYFTRWYLQRLYGQHLDRLESQLRELDEPANAGN